MGIVVIQGMGAACRQQRSTFRAAQGGPSPKIFRQARSPGHFWANKKERNGDCRREPDAGKRDQRRTAGVTDTDERTAKAGRYRRNHSTRQEKKMRGKYCMVRTRSAGVLPARWRRSKDRQQRSQTPEESGTGTAPPARHSSRTTAPASRKTANSHRQSPRSCCSR